MPPLTVNTVGDNPFAPGITAELYSPDQLIAGDAKIVTADITVAHSAALVRGTVMGQITIGAASSAAKGGGNTGNGTFVLDVTTPILANAQTGIYTVRCITAAANGGVFEVKTPKGASLGEFAITGGAGGTVAIADQIKAVITDGGMDFIVGDGFDVTIAAVVGNYLKSVKTAVDGSQDPVGILVDDVDASAADAKGGLYQTGEFNGAKLTFDGSFILSDITAAFRKLGLFVKTAITAGNPT